ncbi:MFS transporter [Phreatobacter sp.]|uniref:MFS transporter n=1 Tax=Phreatobacter sp. TaxID=1966341 RepID=UPI003F6EC122
MQTFLALLLAYIISIFFRSFLSVLASPMMADMGIGATELAAMSSAWFIVFALMQFPVGWALDVYGPRRTVLPLMVVGGIGACLFPFAPDARIGAIAMGLIGVGCSPMYMGALYVFARSHPPRRFGFLASLLIGFGSIGNLVGTTPLALAADHFGWRAAMMAIAGLYLAALAMAALFLRDPPRLAQPGGGSLFAGLGTIVGTRVFWLFVPVVFVSYAVAVTVRGLWVAPYLEQVIGLDRAAQGHVAMAMALAMAASAFLFGWVESRWGLAKTLTLLGNLAVATILGVLALTGTQPALWAALAFTAIGFCGFSYTILMAHLRPFFPDELVGRGITLMNFIFIAGAAAIQAGSGWLIDQGRAEGLDAAATFARMHGALAIGLIASLAVYLFSPPQPTRRPVISR